MDNKQLEQEFMREFRDLDKQPDVTIIVSRRDLWCVMSSVQLACRHPRFTGPTRKRAEKVARLFQTLIANKGALSIVAERGWDPDYDRE